MYTTFELVTSNLPTSDTNTQVIGYHMSSTCCTVFSKAILQAEIEFNLGWGQSYYFFRGVVRMRRGKMDNWMLAVTNAQLLQAHDQIDIHSWWLLVLVCWFVPPRSLACAVLNLVFQTTHTYACMHAMCKYFVRRSS